MQAFKDEISAVRAQYRGLKKEQIMNGRVLNRI